MAKAAEKALKKMDSSKEFVQSHLMRASVITPLPSDGDGEGQAQVGVTGSSTPNGTVSPMAASAEAAAAAAAGSGGSCDRGSSGGGQQPPASGGSEDDEGEERQQDDHHAGGVGCTALSMVVRGSDVLVANTGDSRCVGRRR